MLLDGNALIHRAYHALPPLTTKKGEIVNAVYGFTLTLLGVLEKFKPDYIAASFDLPGGTFRDELYADYKATRVKAPDDLYAQIPRVKEVVNAFNIPIYEKAGFEADDCVGTLARQAEKEGVETIIVTGDMDTLQLVTPKVKIFTMRKGLKDTVLYDEAGVVAKYGLKPNQIIDYKGLCGDASDNIPGVRGIGQKTASALLQEYTNLEGVYAALEKLKPAVAEKLKQDKELAFLSRKLGTIDTICPVNLSLPDAVAKDYDREKIATLLKEFEFFSLLKRIPGNNQQSTVNSQQTEKKKVGKKAKLLKTKAEVEKYLKTCQGKKVAVYLTKEEGSLFGAAIQTVELALTKEEHTDIAWNEETKPPLKDFFEDTSIGKIAYDAKGLMHLLHKENIRLENIAFDVLIAAYLLHSGSDMELDTLILSEIGDEDTQDVASAILTLSLNYEEKLETVSQEQGKEKNLLSVFRKIEMPLMPVLFKMEQNGICLNREKFQTLAKQLGDELATLEKSIYQFAGKEFNINSPKQLSEILFVDLHIPTTNIKKTKTGISTASTELEKLKEYPIVEKIEQYRELFKLKTTYLDVLPTLTDERSRLHTTFQQAVAATGRLSSIDPNLQNIPARSIWSERIRGAFEAQKGYALVGADYSQIELRVMAHLSQDKALLSAFQNKEDIHRTTASVVYKVKPEEVTSDMRRQAKVFNFGIMYGMGAFGLAQAAGIDQKGAGEFITAYFKKFSRVKEFIEEMKKNAREKEYVETELGRRRYVPEINSQNIQVARSGERMAINMPIQGMAADIMKLAMLRVSEALSEYGDDVRMSLQVHDELILEVKENLAEEISGKVKTVMENVYPLSVPLTVETEIGKNWGEI